MTDHITVLISHIPIREEERDRAVASIYAQTRRPDTVHLRTDLDHEGSAATRNHALKSIMEYEETDWVAFLDDDDEFLPHHLDELLRCAIAHEADVVYPGCHVVGGHDPHDRFGQPFDADLLRQQSYIPVTSLVRMSKIEELFKVHGEAFWRPPGSDYDDWGFYLRLLDAGAKFVHHPVKTWLWHHWGYGMPGRPGNTSGMPHRW